MAADNVMPFPKRHRDCDAVDNIVMNLKVSEAEKVTTLVISDGVYSMPGAAFPFPSAAAVDPKYMKALEEQKKKRENG